MDHETRLCFMGDAALANGFRLAGFEVFTDITVDAMDALLRGMCSKRQRAFVVLDHTLAESNSKMIRQLRSEGGNILLAAAPPLNQPGSFHSSIDRHIAQLMGESGESQ